MVITSLIISGLALLISGWSLYNTLIKQRADYKRMLRGKLVDLIQNHDLLKSELEILEAAISRHDLEPEILLYEDKETELKTTAGYINSIKVIVESLKGLLETFDDLKLIEKVIEETEVNFSNISSTTRTIMSHYKNIL